MDNNFFYKKIILRVITYKSTINDLLDLLKSFMTFGVRKSKGLIANNTDIWKN